MLKYNNMLVYQQQLKHLVEEFSNDLSTVLYVLYYILYIYDESVFCFFIRCFMQLILSYVMSSSNTSNEVFPGLSRLGTLGRLSGTSQILRFNTNNNNGNITLNNNSNDNRTPTTSLEPTNRGPADTFDEIENLFSNWTIKEKISFVQKIVNFLIAFWLIMILYQILFCLGDNFNGTCYSFFGSLRKSIRESAYTDKYISDPNYWSSGKAFSVGSVMLNFIGDTRTRSKFNKCIIILLLDFIVITIQLLEILTNYIIGFGIIDRISEEENEEGINNNVENRKFDGRQGRTKVLKVNPFEAFGKLYI